ncbi:MAG: tetratricopeptide repeat protein [Candidatus Omnitrophica bacterium]|nr:tetratricopeptide repeat protein [Candidatus Omnitrophota bacterium]
MLKLMLGILALASACASVYAGDAGVDVKSKALAHYIMAEINDLNGRSAQAIDEYERSVGLNSKEPLPRLRLAAYYIRLGLLEKSVKQLKEVLGIDPQNPQAHYLLALVYSSQKKYDLAAREYEHILKTAAKENPDNLEIYIYLAQLYYSQGKYPEAIVQFNHIVRIQPENISANYLLGCAYLEIKERAKAKEFFQKTLGLEPDHDGALNSLAYMYAEDDVNLDEALAMSRKAVAIDGSSGAYYDTLGWVLFKKSQYAESLVALQKAQAYVEDPVIYEHMGDVYKAVREYALARKFWRKSLSLNPHQPHIQTKIVQLEKTQALKNQL